LCFLIWISDHTLYILSIFFSSVEKTTNKVDGSFKISDECGNVANAKPGDTFYFKPNSGTYTDIIMYFDKKTRTMPPVDLMAFFLMILSYLHCLDCTNAQTQTHHTLSTTVITFETDDFGLAFFCGQRAEGEG
jgi:hypothetical protein